MIPSEFGCKPKLPIINTVNNSDNETDINNDNLGFESDEEIEVLLRKTKFLRQSKSAHADLALSANINNKDKLLKLNGYGIQEGIEDTSSDSDEEFYVHQSLLPFKKSKSTIAGFSSNLDKNNEIKSIGTFKASEILQVIEKQTKEMLEIKNDNISSAFISNHIEYWPPPDEIAEKIDKNKRDSIIKKDKRKKSSDVKTISKDTTPILIPFGRIYSIDSDGQISVKAWSAPSQIDDYEIDNDEDDDYCINNTEHQRMRSWSASDRLPLREETEQKYNKRKGISYSIEYIVNYNDDDEFDVEIDPWKRHHSYDDITDIDREEITSEYSDKNHDDEAEISKIDEINKYYSNDSYSSSSKSSSSSSSEALCGSNESLHTPKSSEILYSPIMQSSRSDSHLKFYISDRPKTPLCGVQNPINSTQQIYDPWHSDVEDVILPAPIKSRSLHDTIDSEEILIQHYQMCPSIDCQQFIEDRREKKSSIKVNIEKWNDDIIDKTVENEFNKLTCQSSESNETFNDINISNLNNDNHEDKRNTEINDLNDKVEIDTTSFQGNLTGNHTYMENEEIPMADDLEVDSPLTPFLARKNIPKRRSPPIASDDDLSDVEMTDLNLSENEEIQPINKYNLSFLVKKSNSDYTCTNKTNMKIDESIGNLNYWINEGKQHMIKRSSTTSAIKENHYRNEPIYENLRQQFLLSKTTSDQKMEQIPRFLTFNQHQNQQEIYQIPQQRKMKKSATSTGFVNPRRRILPLCPDFPPTPEEPLEYSSLPYSKSYHEYVGEHNNNNKKLPFDLNCFFPTTSYNISKEMQHENFARIQLQMEQEEESIPSTSADRPEKIITKRNPSFTALTLADELENEKNGLSTTTIDPKLAMKINGFDSNNYHEESSPLNKIYPQFNNTTNIKKSSTRRTLPPLPIDAYRMSQSPILHNQLINNLQQQSASNTTRLQQQKEDHQICFGIEQSIIRSTSGVYGMEDSYYEDGLNSNFNFPRKSNSLYNTQEDSSGVSSCCTAPDSMTPTHRVQSVFIPRHDDEVLLEIGDPIHVERQCEDHWCYGTNLRTGQHGIFPSAHVCEIDFVEEITSSALSGSIPSRLPENKERDVFYLKMLASIEVAHHKGNDVLIQSINKVCQMYHDKEEIIVSQTILMEVSFRGIHIIDKRRKDFFKCPSFDFFYSLQNISFCGAHPNKLNYFGFITKHPLLPRFACHVFCSNESTQPIVESIGRAFKRSYDEYMAFAHQTVDEYLE